jgi:hypothetical protein
VNGQVQGVIRVSVPGLSRQPDPFSVLTSCPRRDPSTGEYGGTAGKITKEAGRGNFSSAPAGGSTEGLSGTLP